MYNIYLNVFCLRNHFGSETTIIPNNPIVLSNNTDGDTINNRDHTIIDIDTLEVIIKLIS